MRREGMRLGVEDLFSGVVLGGVWIEVVQIFN